MIVKINGMILPVVNILYVSSINNGNFAILMKDRLPQSISSDSNILVLNGGSEENLTGQQLYERIEEILNKYYIV